MLTSAGHETSGAFCAFFKNKKYKARGVQNKRDSGTKNKFKIRKYRHKKQKPTRSLSNYFFQICNFFPHI